MNRRERGLRDRAVMRANWAKIEPPSPPKPAHWLTDFMAREGILHEGGLAASDQDEDEPAEKSYNGRWAAGAAVLLGIGIAASFAYVEVGARHEAHAPARAAVAVAPRAAVALNMPPATHRAEPHAAPSALGMPKAAVLPARPHDVVPGAASADLTDDAFSTFPSQPIEAPPEIFGKWAGALIIPQPESVAPKGAAPRIAASRVATTPAGQSPPTPLLPARMAKLASASIPGLPGATQAPAASLPEPRPSMPASSGFAVAPLPLAIPPSLVKPSPLAATVAPAAQVAAAQPAAMPVSVPASLPVSVPGPMPVTHVAQQPPAILPGGTPLHLRIVYAASDPAEAGQIAALAERLRAEIGDIATARALAGRPRVEDVAYFFSADRAGASRIAAGLAQITKRTAPVVLVHATPLPRPGTIEIRLPLKDGKDLNSEGS
jgi:hypothetical protein